MAFETLETTDTVREVLRARLIHEFPKIEKLKLELVLNFTEKNQPPHIKIDFDESLEAQNTIGLDFGEKVLDEVYEVAKSYVLHHED